MADNQKQEATPELEAEAAEMLGQSQPAAAPTESEPVLDPIPAEPEAAEPSPQSQPPDELKSVLDETPYKGENVVESVKKLAEGYKQLQSQWTKEHELVSKIKPFDKFVNRIVSDPKYAELVQQLDFLYNNPAALQAYQNPQANAMPDPRLFDMTDPSQYQAYTQALSDWQAKQLDSRINVRLSEIEQRAQFEKQKFALKQAFPTIDVDSEWEKISSKKDWTAVDGYKALNYDSLRSQLETQIRKELTEQLTKAQTTKTPGASASQPKTVSVQDILSHITQYGGDSARKKYGEANFRKAMAVEAEAFMGR